MQGCVVEVRPTRASVKAHERSEEEPVDGLGAARSTLPQLAWTMLRIGAVAFGGLGAALVLLERGLVDRLGLVTKRDLADALAFTKPLPGSTVVQVVGFLGFRLRRWPGALIASVMFVAPSFALMVAAAAALVALPVGAAFEGALTGVHVVVVGFLASAMWGLACSQARGPVLAAVLGMGFVAGLVLNAALVVVGAGAVGAVTTAIDSHRG